MKIIKTTLVLLPPLLTVAAIILAILKHEGKLDKYLKQAPATEKPPAISREFDFSRADDDTTVIEPGAAPTASAAADSTTQASPETAAVQPEEAVPLTLSQAEANILALAESLSNLPLWQKCLAQTTPIQRFVAALDAVALGKRPLESLDFLAPTQPFSADRQGQNYCQSQHSQERFSEAVNLFCSFSPAAVARLYMLLEPACQEALEKLGYRDKHIRELLTSACTTILQTPMPQEEPLLTSTPTANIFLWQNPELEQLNEAQKLFLRLGRKNSAAVRHQLASIADQLHLYQDSTSDTP